MKFVQSCEQFRYFYFSNRFFNFKFLKFRFFLAQSATRSVTGGKSRTTAPGLRWAALSRITIPLSYFSFLLSCISRAPVYKSVTRFTRALSYFILLLSCISKALSFFSHLIDVIDSQSNRTPKNFFKEILNCQFYLWVL